jgi:Ca2+-binding EF-hand superfamily protein
MAAARKTFSGYDVDGDGTVSSMELYSILKMLLLELELTDTDANDKAKHLMDIIDAGNICTLYYLTIIKMEMGILHSSNSSKVIIFGTTSKQK